jgi:hypothetical protein
MNVITKDYTRIAANKGRSNIRRHKQWFLQWQSLIYCYDQFSDCCYTVLHVKRSQQWNIRHIDQTPSVFTVNIDIINSLIV